MQDVQELRSAFFLSHCVQWHTRASRATCQLGKVKEVVRFCVQNHISSDCLCTCLRADLEIGITFARKLGAYFFDSLINGWELSFGDVG